VGNKSLLSQRELVRQRYIVRIKDLTGYYGRL